MKIQYLGHSCVKIYAADTVLLIDPFLSGQGLSAQQVKQLTADVTHIALTHGHADHVGDTVAIAQGQHHAGQPIPVIAMVELAIWLEGQGVKTARQANFGGSVAAGSLTVTLVPAWHTSSGPNGEYLGNPAGLIIMSATQTLYHAGDTCLFGDMALINQLYQPTIGLLPIGGTYTMDAAAAAYACQHFFNFKHVIPIHYATFPVLEATADTFVKHLENQSSTQVVPLQPGQFLNV